MLRAADAAFGHRLMMDRVMPGGVAADLEPAGAAAIGALVRLVGERFPLLVDLYDDTASLQDRTVATGIVGRELVERFGAGGFVGRASGRRVRRPRGVPLPALRRARRSRSRPATKATSTPGSGCGSTKSGRASA